MSFSRPHEAAASEALLSASLVFSVRAVSASRSRCLQKGDPWNVRVLPKVVFGVHPMGLDDMGPGSPGIAVQHHFVGTWKKKGGWGIARQLSPARLVKRLLAYLFEVEEEE